MRAVLFGAVSAALLAVSGSLALAADPIAKVKYTCADARTIEATYWPEKVDIVLSDGRAMTLPQTMSGSGARYANADELVVFWNKGDDAFVTEGDPNKPTYADCVGAKM